MKMKSNKHNERGLTLVEVLVVVAVVVVFGALLLPAFAKPRSGRYLTCAANLKQIGLGMRLFSDDHAGRFPWLVSKAEGGSLEYADSTEVFRHFLAASNEINNPRVLVCPSDRLRTKEGEWGRLSNGSLSYFVGLEARASRPASALAGDRTIWVAKNPATGLVVLTPSAPLRIRSGMHGDFINMLHADGSVWQLTDKRAKNWVMYSNQLPVKLVVP